MNYWAVPLEGPYWGLLGAYPEAQGAALQPINATIRPKLAGTFF